MSLKVKCPACRSTRIRRGYKQTPLWSKLIFRYNLLCDSCNWQFVAFALPWQIPMKSIKRSRSSKPETETADSGESLSAKAEQKSMTAVPVSTEEDSVEELKPERKSKTAKQKKQTVEQRTISET